jgi:phage/plasmid-associated DNA primase
MLNVDSESADTRLGSSELNTLKALTGGDKRQVDVKHEEPFEMENDAKLAFAANNPPRFDEETDAVADRLLTIELPYRFANDEDGDKAPIPERRLMRELTSDEELSGLLNKAIEGLQRIRDRGCFSIEENTTARDRFESYQADADSIVGFASRCLKNEQGFAMPKSAVYSAYTEYCDEHEHTPAERAAFFRQVGRKTGIETHPKRPRIGLHGSDDRRTNVLDHCWIADAGIQHLSEPAREDMIKVIQHMYAGNVDYAHDLLLRGDSGGGGTAIDADDTDPATAAESEVSQAERVEEVRSSLRVLAKKSQYQDAGGVPRMELVAAVANDGVTPDDAKRTIDSLVRDGDVIERADDRLLPN